MKLRIECEFFAGISAKPPGVGYMPHFVTQAELLGVRFLQLPERILFGEKILAEVACMYEGVDYSSLKPGADFKILEGDQIVGHGRVL